MPRKKVRGSKKGRSPAKQRKLIPNPSVPGHVFGASLCDVSFACLGYLRLFVSLASPHPPPPFFFPRTPMHIIIIITVHCINMCGVIYDTPNKEVDRVEWSKTLRRLNAHESKRCRAARRGADGKLLPAKPGADGSVMGPPSAAAAAAESMISQIWEAPVQHDPAAVRPQLPRRAAHRTMEQSQAEADWAVLGSGGRRKIGERLGLGRHRSQWSRVKRRKIGPSQLNETRNLIRLGSWGDLPDGGVDSQARRHRLSRHQSANSFMGGGSQGAPGARNSLSRNSSPGERIDIAN